MLYSISVSAVAITAAATDLVTRRIPNLLTGACIIFGLALHWRLQGLPGLTSSAAAGVMLGSIFLALYVAGGMGAGDVKLMTAVGCLSGGSSLQMILTFTVVCGVLLALCIAVCRKQLRQTIHNTWLLLQHHRQHGFHHHEDINLRSTNALKMPFALPIAMGCLISLGFEMGR